MSKVDNTFNYDTGLVRTSNRIVYPGILRITLYMAV
jgi:hypothetical protein